MTDLKSPEMTMLTLGQEVSASQPLMILTTAGADPSSELRDAASQLAGGSLVEVGCAFRYFIQDKKYIGSLNFF